MRASKLAWGLLLSLTIAASAAQATATIDANALAALQAMRDVNLIVLGDYTAGHEVEGKVWVGGDVNGSTFNVGVGNAHQGSGVSAYSTLTVGGDLNVSVNVNDGATSTGTAGTGAYGVTVAGNVNQQLTFNANGSVNRIGGNLNADENIGSNAVLSVAGYAKSITGSGATTINVGSVSGSNASINVGAGSTVNVATGGVGSITTADGSTTHVGGSVNSLTTGANTTTTITGTVGSQNFNAGNGSTTYAAAYGSNNVNAMGSCDQNTHSCTAIANAYISGGDPNAGNDQNNWSVNGGQPPGWHFNTAQTLTAPSAPAAFSLAADKATMAANMTDLSQQLGALGPNAFASEVAGGSGIYDELFTVADPTASSVVFSISAAELFGARNIGFNLNGYTGAVVINVTGFGSGSYNFSQGAYTGGGAVWDSSLNEYLLWNFGDASTSSSLSVTNIFHGSILDPNGTVSNSTPIEGSVVAGVFQQGGEVHLGTLLGDVADDTATNTFTTLSTTVPESASWALMILGFGAVGATLRRRRLAAA